MHGRMKKLGAMVLIGLAVLITGCTSDSGSPSLTKAQAEKMFLADAPLRIAGEGKLKPLPSRADGGVSCHEADGGWSCEIAMLPPGGRALGQDGIINIGGTVKRSAHYDEAFICPDDAPSLMDCPNLGVSRNALTR